MEEKEEVEEEIEEEEEGEGGVSALHETGSMSWEGGRGCLRLPCGHVAPSIHALECAAVLPPAK